MLSFRLRKFAATLSELIISLKMAIGKATKGMIGTEFEISLEL